MQCTAKSKQSGVQCRRMATQGRNVCAMHGGKSLIGPAHPRFDHGRYSKLLPVALAARYEAGRRDPELLALRDEIALTDARLTEVLDRWAADPARVIWADALALIEQRRRLCATEAKRLVDMQQFITAEQAHVLIGRLVQIVTSEVTDRATLARIAAGVAALVGRADDDDLTASVADEDILTESSEVQL